MPKPGYIVCALSGAMDQHTNAVSAFNIVESIRVRKIDRSKAVILTPVSMMVVATWLREDSDAPDVAYEGRFVARFPDPGVETEIATFSEFFFVTPIHRLLVPSFQFPGFPAIGQFLIECMIRQ